MKKFFIIASVLLAAVACKQGLDIENSAQEIVIGVGDSFRAEFETKATAVTSMPASLYYGIRQYSPDALVFSPASGTVSSGQISTGLFKQPNNQYKYFVSNVSFAESGVVTVDDNNTDIIVGYVQTDSATPDIELRHIYARTGSLTLNGPSGYTVSNVVWTLNKKYGQSCGTKGTYAIWNYKSSASGGWNNVTGLESSMTFTSSSDLYIVPATYVVTVSYTLSKAGWSQNYNHNADIAFTGNKINNIIGTITFHSGEDEPSEIVMNLSLTDWTEIDIPATF